MNKQENWADMAPSKPEAKKQLTADQIFEAIDAYATACEKKDWSQTFDGPTLSEIRRKNEAYAELHRLVAMRDDKCIPYEGQDQ